MTTLLPPMWQAAQLALKILAPLLAFPARAEGAKAKADSAIANKITDNSFFKVVLPISIQYPSILSRYGYELASFPKPSQTPSCSYRAAPGNPRCLTRYLKVAQSCPWRATALARLLYRCSSSKKSGKKTQTSKCLAERTQIAISSATSSVWCAPSTLHTESLRKSCLRLRLHKCSSLYHVTHKLYE